MMIGIVAAACCAGGFHTTYSRANWHTSFSLIRAPSAQKRANSSDDNWSRNKASVL
jgi:hypothetical protein